MQQYAVTLSLISLGLMGTRPPLFLGFWMKEKPSVLHTMLWWRRPLLVSVKVRLQGPLLKWGPRLSVGVIGGSDTMVVP